MRSIEFFLKRCVPNGRWTLRRWVINDKPFFAWFFFNGFARRRRGFCFMVGGRQNHHAEILKLLLCTVNAISKSTLYVKEIHSVWNSQKVSFLATFHPITTFQSSLNLTHPTLTFQNSLYLTHLTLTFQSSPKLKSSNFNIQKLTSPNYNITKLVLPIELTQL